MTSDQHDAQLAAVKLAAGKAAPGPWWLTWPVEEVAATILSCFSAWDHRDEPAAIDDVIAWCKTGSRAARKTPLRYQYYRNPFDDPDCRSIAEAIRVLEHADLLMRLTSNVKSPEIGLTRRGMHALQTNAVRQHLGLSDAPPQP
jgi:hypothetical protein